VTVLELSVAPAAQAMELLWSGAEVHPIGRDEVVGELRRREVDDHLVLSVGERVPGVTVQPLEVSQLRVADGEAEQDARGSAPVPKLETGGFAWRVRGFLWVASSLLFIDCDASKAIDGRRRFLDDVGFGVGARGPAKPGEVEELITPDVVDYVSVGKSSMSARHVRHVMGLSEGQITAKGTYV
jgi:hypothetical protein